MSEPRNQQKGSGGQKPGQQRNQAEVDKKRKRWREVGRQQEEQDKKRRESGVVPGDDKAPHSSEVWPMHAPVVLQTAHEREEITVAVRADDLLNGDTADPEQHPIAIALRRQDDVDDARVTKTETLVRRGKKWFRYNAPDKRLFNQLQKTLTAAPD
jgi:hypothetical protein